LFQAFVQKGYYKSKIGITLNLLFLNIKIGNIFNSSAEDNCNNKFAGGFYE